MLLIPNVRLIFWTVIWKEHLVELLPQQNCSYVHFNSSWLTSHQQSQKPWILTSQHIDNPYPSYPYLEHFLRTYQFTKYHNLRCLRRQLSLKLVAFSYHLSTMNLTQHKQPSKTVERFGHLWLGQGTQLQTGIRLKSLTVESRLSWTIWSPLFQAKPPDLKNTRQIKFRRPKLALFFLLGCQLHVRNKLSKI